MKILIWAHKNDVLANKIWTYHFTRPIIDRHDDYLQVEITQDEFARLEDNKELRNVVEEIAEEEDIDNETDREAEWLVGQYNRNRESKDHVNNVDDIDQNNQAFGD